MKGSGCYRNLVDGGGMGSRTPDLLNAIQTLYQLSYTPEKDVNIVSEFPRWCQRKFSVALFEN